MPEGGLRELRGQPNRVERLDTLGQLEFVRGTRRGRPPFVFQTTPEMKSTSSAPSLCGSRPAFFAGESLRTAATTPISIRAPRVRWKAGGNETGSREGRLGRRRVAAPG